MFMPLQVSPNTVVSVFYTYIYTFYAFQFKFDYLVMLSF